MKEAVTVYAFDFDGVLCDIGAFTVDERVMGLIAELLRRGNYCAINTGRGYDRVGAEFVEPFRQKFPDVSLDRFMSTTEMGGEVTTFAGNDTHSERTKFAMTPEELKLFYDVWEAHKEQLPAMYLYTSKQSMATTVWDHTYDEATYKEQKDMFENYLRGAYVDTDIVVTGTGESTDVHASDAGKNAGAANIVEWLDRVSDVKHDSAVCLGDSHNDYEMARHFADAGFTTTFVYTGENLLVPDLHDAVKLIDTTSNYTDGTVEYLQGVI